LALRNTSHLMFSARRRVLLLEHVSPAMLKRCSQGTLFVFVKITLFGRIRTDYSDHYSAPKRIFDTEAYWSLVSNLISNAVIVITL